MPEEIHQPGECWLLQSAQDPPNSVQKPTSISIGRSLRQYKEDWIRETSFPGMFEPSWNVIAPLNKENVVLRQWLWKPTGLRLCADVHCIRLVQKTHVRQRHPANSLRWPRDFQYPDSIFVIIAVSHTAGNIHCMVVPHQPTLWYPFCDGVVIIQSLQPATEQSTQGGCYRRRANQEMVNLNTAN
jgi:hypothetical protein